MIQILGHFGHGFGGHGFHSGPGFAGGPGFDGSLAYGPHSAGLFGSHLMGLVVLVSIGIALWFFATGRHRSLATAGAAAPTSAHYAAHRPADIDPAEEVARERFARGDITADEYSAIITTLRGH